MSQQYLTISALTKYLKRKFDVDPHLSKVYVVGEVSNFTLRPTHQYFTLKDDSAKIKVVCYQQVYRKCQCRLEEGMKILAIGRVSLYEPTGEYQLYVEHMELSGTGALYQAYKQLHDKLKQEGLFDLPKKPIPKFPKKIALVTSESGAVLHDIKTTIMRRYPIVALHVYPTVVQGQKSVTSILSNLKRITESEHDYDTVIVARGGGSIEDLWSFNDESVVRAIAHFDIPIISSIGHETDTTLTDFAADLRAATPTAAAECSVPVLVDVLRFSQQIEQRLINAMQLKIKQFSDRFERTSQSYIFKQPERLYDGYLQKLDRTIELLQYKMIQQLSKRQQQFERVNYQFELSSPLQKLDEYREKQLVLYKQLQQFMRLFIERQEKGSQLLIQKLDLLSPLKNMARGYSLVSLNNSVVSSVDKLKQGDCVTIDMTDGKVAAVVQSIESKER